MSTLLACNARLVAPTLAVHLFSRHRIAAEGQKFYGVNGVAPRNYFEVNMGARCESARPDRRDFLPRGDGISDMHT